MRVSVRPEFAVVQLVPPLVERKTPSPLLTARMALALATKEVMTALAAMPELASEKVAPLSDDL